MRKRRQPIALGGGVRSGARSLWPADGLKHLDFNEASPRMTAKGDWREVAIARTICELTAVRRDWIAERLDLKSAGSVGQRLRLHRLSSEKAGWVASRT